MYIEDSNLCNARSDMMRNECCRFKHNLLLDIPRPKNLSSAPWPLLEEAEIRSAPVLLDHSASFESECYLTDDKGMSDQDTTPTGRQSLNSTDLSSINYFSTFESDEFYDSPDVTDNSEWLEAFDVVFSPLLTSEYDDSDSGNMSADSLHCRPLFNFLSSAFCAEHDMKKILFCAECDESLCFLCKTSRHARHTITTIKNAAIEHRELLKQMHQKLRENEIKFKCSLKKQTGHQRTLTTNRASVMEVLGERKKYLHELVERWYSKMTLQVDVVCSYEKDKITSQIEEITANINELQETIDHIEHILLYHQAADFLALSSDLKHDAQSMLLLQPDVPTEQLSFMFNLGTGIEYDNFGNFTVSYHTDNQVGMQVISHTKLVFSFDTRQDAKSDYLATGLSLSHTGDLIVTDFGLDLVQMFSKLGQHLQTLNTLPADEPTKAVEIDSNTIVVACKTDLKFFDGNGNFGRKLKKDISCPNGLAVSHTGDVIVTDRAEDGHFIHVLSKTGELLHSVIGGHRAPCFQKPWYVTSDESDNIYVTDYLEHCVKIFNRQGAIVTEFGGQGAQAGCFFRPAGICLDNYGHILVADSGNNRVQMFGLDGTFQMVLLNKDKDDLLCPMDILISGDEQLVVLQGNGVVATYKYIYWVW